MKPPSIVFYSVKAYATCSETKAVLVIEESFDPDTRGQWRWRMHADKTVVRGIVRTAKQARANVRKALTTWKASQR